MKIARIQYRDRKSLFWLSNADSLPTEIQVDETGRINSQNYYRPTREFGFCKANQSFVKMKRRKYSPLKRPLSWFFRDFVRDRLLLQFESRKERLGNKRTTRIGLDVAKNMGWGISINPFNEFLSVYFSSFLEEQTVYEVFKASEKSRRLHILEQISDSLAKCVADGFAIKDPAFSNIFVKKTGELIWIDTETKRVFSKKHAIRTLNRIFSAKFAPDKPFHHEGMILKDLVLDRLNLTRGTAHRR